MGRDKKVLSGPGRSDRPGPRDAANETARRPRRHRPATPAPYVELHGASAFSFLRGASLPEDLMGRAAEAELPAMALMDVNGFYGAPRFYQAARRTGVRAPVRAELALSPEAFWAWGE